jgi:hypothetical protein
MEYKNVLQIENFCLLLSVEIVYLKKILKEGSMKKKVNWGKVGALGNIGLIILNIINLIINIMR